MGFLKTILILLLVYFALKFLLRFLAPYLFKYISKKMASRFQQAFGGEQNQQNSTKPEGSVSIDKVPKSNSKSKSTVGEYVDYEEID